MRIQNWILIIVFFFAAFGSQAQSKEQVYAGIILHIMKYVEWPSDNSAQMSIGIVNDPQLTTALNAVAKGKKVHFKDVTAIRYSDINSVKDCHVLFLPKKSTPKVGSITDFSTKNNVLVITEMKSQGVNGSCINFFEDQGKLKFELFSMCMNKAGLKVSEQLKKYAIVRT